MSSYRIEVCSFGEVVFLVEIVLGGVEMDLFFSSFSNCGNNFFVFGGVGMFSFIVDFLVCLAKRLFICFS